MPAVTSVRRLLPLALASLLSAIAGGLLGAAIYAQAFHDDPTERGSIVRFGRGFHDIEQTPFCVPLQHFCLVQLDSGEIRALYAYDTHQWSRERNCEVTWRPDMLFTDPATQVESRGWFRAGCSGTTYRYTGERVFGPGPRSMDEFPVEEKLETFETSDGETLEVEYLEVDTWRLICGETQLDVPEDCERAPRPE